MDFKFDENDDARVILTKAGADTINKYSVFLNKHSESEIQFKTDYKEDDVYQSQVWNIMKIFYGTNHGTEKQFKEISIIK